MSAYLEGLGTSPKIGIRNLLFWIFTLAASLMEVQGRTSHSHVSVKSWKNLARSPLSTIAAPSSIAV